MKHFEAFVDSGEVKRASVDKHMAASLLEQAKRRAEFLQEQALTERTREFILDDAYEVMRTLADAWLALHGYKSYSHEATISFLQNDPSFSVAFLEGFDRLRRLRNGIRYYGKRVSVNDATLAREQSRAFLAKMEQKIAEKSRQ